MSNTHSTKPALQETWFVGRHHGARVWVERQGICVHHWCEHLDPQHVQAGDKVIGTLPVQLAAEICARGAEYWHLVLSLRRDERGVELSAEQLDCAHARLQRFVVLAGAVAHPQDPLLC